jgi:hypothetical protein
MRRGSNEQGFIFLSGLALASSLLIFLSIGAIRSVTELSASERFLAKQRAFYLAEGRLDEALVQLAADPSATGNCATAADPAYGTSACLITDPGDGTRVITATGTVLGVQQNLQAVVEPQGGVSPFQWAIYGGNGMHLRGQLMSPTRSIIDSYDSTGAPGGENQATIHVENPLPPGGYVIGFGMTMNGWGGLDLYGDAVIGLGGDPNTAILDSTNWPAFSDGVVHGEKRAATAPVTLPTVTPPSGSSAGGVLNSCPADPVIDVADFDYSSIILPSDCQITLAGDGVVHLDDLDIGAGSSVSVEGHVTLSTSSMELRSGAVFRVGSGSAAVYVTGMLTVLAPDNTRWINVTEDPKSLTLYVQGQSAIPLITTGGALPNVPFYGAVFAPSSSIMLVGGMFSAGPDFHGSFIGDFVGIWHDTNVHFDVSLKDLVVNGSGGGSGASGASSLRSWRQF